MQDLAAIWGGGAKVGGEKIIDLSTGFHYLMGREWESAQRRLVGRGPSEFGVLFRNVRGLGTIDFIVISAIREKSA